MTPASCCHSKQLQDTGPVSYLQPCTSISYTLAHLKMHWTLMCGQLHWALALLCLQTTITKTFAEHHAVFLFSNRCFVVKPILYLVHSYLPLLSHCPNETSACLSPVCGSLWVPHLAQYGLYSVGVHMCQCFGQVQLGEIKIYRDGSLQATALSHAKLFFFFFGNVKTRQLTQVLPLSPSPIYSCPCVIPYTVLGDQIEQPYGEPVVQI